MPARQIGLDNPAFQGRLRRPEESFSFRQTSPVRRRNYLINDYAAPAPPKPQPIQAPETPVWIANYIAKQVEPQAANTPKRFFRPQLALYSLAGLVLVIGLAVSLQGFQANRKVAAQAVTINKAQSADATPSTIKPSSSAVRQYVVAPDLPRYLKIPRLGVFARVMQTGVTTSGALGTPSNIYDTAWYTGSSKPGQAGATLIDGHVSSWTSPGVFVGLKKLSAGDRLQVVRGDGTQLNYKVIKTQVYDAKNVDMQAALTPVTAGKSGLNLITCTGKVQKGTSQFNQRLIVFAEQD